MPKIGGWCVEVDERHADVEQQHREGDAIGVTAEDADDVGEHAGGETEDQLAEFFSSYSC